VLCGSQMRPILCLMILTSYLMVRGSIRGAKESPPSPLLNRSSEAGKSIPWGIIWRIEYKKSEKMKQTRDTWERERERKGGDL